MESKEYVCKILRAGSITLPAELRRKEDLRDGDVIKVTFKIEKVLDAT